MQGGGVLVITLISSITVQLKEINRFLIVLLYWCAKALLSPTPSVEDFFFK